MTPEYKARRAAELLNDEVFKDILALTEAEITAEWKSSRVIAHVKREKLWMELAALERMKRRFQSIIDNAKLK